MSNDLPPLDDASGGERPLARVTRLYHRDDPATQQSFQRMTPGDVARTPGLTRLVTVPPSEAAEDAGQPEPLYRLMHRVRVGQVQPRRSLAEAIAAAKAQDPEPVPAPTPRCPRCAGSGWLVADVPFGHPDFGQLHACPCQEPKRRERHVRMGLELSALRYYRDQTFATFETRTNPSLGSVLEVARDYAQRDEGKVFLLVGAYGVGKTHLAAAIANARCDGGATVIFETVPDLLEHFRISFGPQDDGAEAATFDALFEHARSCDLLVLDDLGTEHGTSWAREKLFQIVNHRARAGLPLVITTNQAPGRIDPRLRSRIHEGLYGNKAWVLLGPDRRRDHVIVAWEDWQPGMETLPPPRHPHTDEGAYDRGEGEDRGGE